jgi:Tfp pilus assembly protein PilN
MTQINLLPDVKMQYIQAQRRKRLVVGLSVIVAGTFLALMILLLLFVKVYQPQHMNAVDEDINKSVATLKENKDLDKILTIQNQLASLPQLHDNKKISSRTFDYLRKVTPTNVTISDVELDFDAGTLNIKGNADKLSTVNKFADSLKFTKFKVEGDEPGEGNAFTNVVLASFEVQESADLSGGQAGKIKFELTMNFDSAIYKNTAPSSGAKSSVDLVVPNIVTTRSKIQSPDVLFVPQPNTGGAN